jgi:hydrogenase maturation protein HypF
MGSGQGSAFVVQGVVQGVGFRPFVQRVATAERLAGWVRNAPDGVHIAVYGDEVGIARFRHRLGAEAPPLARIDRVTEGPVNGPAPAGFTILASVAGEVRTGIVPDAATCADCRRELFDPADRRYGYPFLNCTNCGPRFSIVEGLPYDRANTAMAGFAMCDECAAEYRDPADRRFHAQATACPTCGPAVWLESIGDGVVLAGGDAAILAVQARLAGGEICAIKGIGGFHLACSAVDEVAVRRLRQLKRRPAKPLALMVSDLAVAERFCRLEGGGRALLASPAAPIVLVAIRRDAELPAAIAPGLDRLGLMLPHSPLHLLLMAGFETPLVMTSGNAHGEPQATGNDQARSDLALLADVLLLHDRRIANRVDDSVVQVAGGRPQVLRRGRGLAPRPLPLPSGFARDHPAVLALGGDIKNAFAVAKGGRVVLSPHIGDLSSLRALADLEATLGLFLDLQEVAPDLVVADPHPGYRASRVARDVAERRNIPLVDVAHHHAHAAACMAEHGLPLGHPPVLALVQDGIGLGEDGALWGAELLACNYRQARRLATLRPTALPGGDRAALEPWRNLAAQLAAVDAEPAAWPEVFRRLLAGRPVEAVTAAIRAGVNAPPASSAGRLFDAVAAALGLIAGRQDYEGEAAMRLEAMAEQWVRAHGRPGGYRFAVGKDEEGLAVVDPAPLWPAIAQDLQAGATPSLVGARFHSGWARVWAALAGAAPAAAEPVIVLSGGVFQNRLLAAMLASDLEVAGWRVLQHQDVPANDGGLALGQVVIALARHHAEAE